MDLSCKLFFETPHKTLTFQQQMLPMQTKKKKKKISKHDKMEVFSADIQRKKIMFINNVQVMLLQSERVSEMHFPAI